jgi:DNA-binding response OmpR family regulator
MSDTVLVVDDEPAICEVLLTWLQGAGYETYAASNGLEGLQELHQRRPDLVVADIVMPQMDGYEMCRLMRELTGAPIMFLTGLSMDTDRVMGLSLGADDYLVKPVQMNHFLSKVSSLIGSRGRCPFKPTLQVLPPRSAGKPRV